MLNVNHLIGFGADNIYIPDGINRIPTMTGATTSGVTAAASANTGTAWRTGDRTTTEWNSGSSGTFWLRYDFGAPQIIASYSVRYGGATTLGSPPGWTFQGSDDNSSWVNLDTQSGLTWTNNQKRTFNLAGPATYRYYRWNGLTGNNPASHWCYLDEVELMS